MRVIDSWESSVPKITITDMIPLLLEEIEKRNHLDLMQLKAELEQLPEFEQLRLSAPHLWIKACKRELKDDPFFAQMMRNIEQVQSGQKTLKKAWKEVEKSVTEEFVHKKIGAPDQFGRPKK